MASSQRPNPVDNLLRGFTAPADHHLLPPPDPEHAAIFARLQEGSNRRQSLYRDVLQSLSRALLEGLRFKKSSSTQENGKSPQLTSSGSPIEQYRNSPPESESRGLASRRNSRNQSERQGSSNEEPGFFTTGEKHQTEFDFDIYERLDLGYGSVAPLTHSQEEYGNTIPFAFRPSRDEPEPPLDFDQESRTGDQPILEYKPPSASYQSDPAEGPFSRAARSAVPAKMENPRTSRFLDPASARDSVMTSQKVAAIKIAKEQEKAIHEKLRRNGHDIPKYEFQELIGKGAYGRVFKCLDQEHNRVVALKVIDVDTTDYKVNARAKDETIDVTVHEIKVLSQLKDSKAKNVNIMFDAFQIHSQLWIVNDYCPGGSVHTLMRATASKLEEKYIVPVARELAEALKAIHTAGIIHRDVKSANVMIHENGSLQVIDFGVAGVLQTKVDKRTTVIGTPHWMPPELHKLAPPEGLTYGTEVDVWAYGCTLYEIATGQPPNFRVEPGRRLGATLGRNAPRLDSDRFSEGLCNLVAFVLEGKPADRPSMDAVLQERYINNSEETHPTRSLAELVKTYYRWERSGGQRQSLFFAGGAPAAEYPETLDNEGSWNFSLTESFEQEFVDTETLNSNPAPAVTINVEQAADTSFDSYLLSPTVYTPVT
ncbi:hypothetical protein MMC08_004274, partial [Hypocenomyce scalaris]|nr:hypothetical protein [Hypocenomyce scalaris]